MLYSGKKIALRAKKKNKYSNSRVVRKQISERKKIPYPPPPPSCKLNGRSRNPCYENKRFGYVFVNWKKNQGIIVHVCD